MLYKEGNMNGTKGDKYRITILADRLIRLEYQEDGLFEDRATQTVLNRVFGDVPFDIKESVDSVVIDTGRLVLTYDKKEFSSVGLSILVKATGKTWHYGDVYGNSDRNLGGTARTLDLTDGFILPEPGLFGEYGYAFIDDSRSAVTEDGEYKNRRHRETDVYFFGYGRDYYAGLRDFYHLTGKTPMIPRYALGNWWSRYHKYTEKTYLELLENFKKEGIPLSVAVIDMDWHLTDVDEKYGTGWTGYTWNPEYFPDHRRFLQKLKDRKLAVTLNLHPADGIRGFEAMYERVAGRLGIDPASDQACRFDFSDPAFRQAYFEEIIHPYENDGVDFWWIDWQQGEGKENDDVDPLFLLNHYHYKDQEGRNSRPMIFSRYAGVGSHRYPVGFSGDTFATWKSLAFQPYFTSMASNIGYGWWSHDIGGHMQGSKDDERLIRWIQFGVFSPIMRIHSSDSPFSNKEPWKLAEPYRSIMGDMMRLRHRLIPYLYTAVWQSYKEDIPLIQPMYYRYPDISEAYEVPDEYMFGGTLCVCAICRPQDGALRMASVNAFIPEGRWYDIFTGMILHGNGNKRRLYRDISSIPVLLPAGGIVPLAANDRGNGTENPESIELLIGAGADGTYSLYEDDGTSMDYMDGKHVITSVSFSWGADDSSCVISIAPPAGDRTLIPDRSGYRIKLYGVSRTENTQISCINGSIGSLYDEYRNILEITLNNTDISKEIAVKVSGIALAQNDIGKLVFNILDRAWIETNTKEAIYRELSESPDIEKFVQRLQGMDANEELKEAIKEVCC